jgi:hypothetical protein
MPPGVAARRLAAELGRQAERVSALWLERSFDDAALLRRTGCGTVEGLWHVLDSRPAPFVATSAGARAVTSLLPGEHDRVLAAAERAVAREVDLLGSGPLTLGRPVRWCTDPKSGVTWPDGYGPSLDVVDAARPSDVKLPWELSRMQWLLPAGQAYLLTGDERYAAAARDVLDEWIAANPYLRTVNWAVAMEAALRIYSWVFLFHSLGASASWEEPSFRSRFLRTLWLHAVFVSRHLELSAVNGNHLDADAAGLVGAGLFFPGREPSRWSRLGWQILERELPRQVTSDGVDFEMSCAYHRLVAELFLLPALWRLRAGLDVPDGYRDRMAAMAGFAASYTRDDGSSPLWGDADDGRALPLGGQPLGDHRYLAGLIGIALDRPKALALAGGHRSEAAWFLGAEAAARLPAGSSPVGGTHAFVEGGVYVLRGARDHVFVDCGPVGLGGRGGHGHNDCLSFEAVLAGEHLVVDSGSFVYTASLAERDRFRSTASHNTPAVDGAELNRFVGSPWFLANDATPKVALFRTAGDVDVLVAAHSGYVRLSSPVTPERTIALDRGAHVLAVRDRFAGTGAHHVSIPFHLAAGVAAEAAGDGRWWLRARGVTFVFELADPDAWQVHVEPAWISPSYGVRTPITRLRLEREGPLNEALVAIGPELAGDLLARARAALSST